MVFPLFRKLDAHVQAVAKDVCASFNSLRSDAVRFALLDAAGIRDTPPLTADIAWRAVFRCVSFEDLYFDGIPFWEQCCCEPCALLFVRTFSTFSFSRKLTYLYILEVSYLLLYCWNSPVAAIWPPLVLDWISTTVHMSFRACSDEDVVFGNIAAVLLMIFYFFQNAGALLQSVNAVLFVSSSCFCVLMS